MLRYVIPIGLLLISLSACSSTEAASQATEPQETHEDDAHNDAEEYDHEEEHNDDHEDEHEHEEEHGDDHEDDHEADGDHQAAGEHREHRSHEHGAAELMIAWSGNDLAIDLQTPAYNVLGFEYAPTTEAEQALLDESVTALQADDLLQFSPEANCMLTSATVETELADEAHEDEEEAETHSDIDVSYNIQCQQPDNLESLDVSRLFAQFPNFAGLRAQWVSDIQQSAKELTPDDPVLSFE